MHVVELEAKPDSVDAVVSALESIGAGAEKARPLAEKL
mgnify:CR=1 FL=1